MGAPATVLAPVAEGERIADLDVVRGFALLGILLMNVEFFGRALADLDSGMVPGTTGVDHWADWFVHVFVRGKFWTMFSLLFGMGFAVMLGRAEARGAPFAAPYLRRTLALGVIGVAHYVLLWGGDILFSYSVGALLLLVVYAIWRRAFRAGPARGIRNTGVVLYVLPFALMLAAGVTMLAGDFQPDPQQQAVQAQAIAQTEARIAGEAEVMQHGSHAAAVAWRVQELPRQLGINAVFAVIVLGVFLLGAWLVRSGIMREPSAHLPLFRRMAWIGIPLGLGLALAGAAIETTHVRGTNDARFQVAMALDTLGALPASLGYIGALVLAFHGRWHRQLALLAPAGRMALTNYLLQSLVGVLLFHGYGLGLWGMGRAAQVLLVLVVFAAQVALSHWWLARYRYGPVEWLWRAVTYLRLPAMRRG